MATDGGATMSDLISRLHAAPHGFDLFQAISLLERDAPARAAVGTAHGVDEAVRLGGQTDFAFPASDVASLRMGEGQAPMLRTASMTLGGGHGPLATPFSELLLERRRQRDHAGLDFLDIFNARLIGFWYRARCKRHVALGRRRFDDTGLARAVDSLSGLGLAEQARGPGSAHAWLRHASLQGAAPRSVAGLLALLRERLDTDFDARQMVGAWQGTDAGERASLGGRRLGSGVSLGARAWNQAAGIALTTPPLPAGRFGALLPGADRHGLLAWLVARYVQEGLTVTLQPALAFQPASRLGRASAPPLAPALGRSAWLCSGAPSTRHYERPCFVLRAAAAGHDSSSSQQGSTP